MSQTVRDQAVLRNNLEAAIRAGGSAGVPLRQTLAEITGHASPFGADYYAAERLKKDGKIFFIRNLPKGGMTAYHRDFANGGAAVPAAEPQAKLPAKKVRANKKRRRHSVGILITLQYGNHETVTLSYEQARDVYTQLAGMFGA